MSIDDRLRDAARAVDSMWADPDGTRDRLARLQSQLEQEEVAAGSRLSRAHRGARTVAIGSAVPSGERGTVTATLVETRTTTASLREQIRDHVVDGIVDGRWQPGERIVERRIATELEVSQTSVREALRELESLRLIESAPNKGVRVRNLTAADLEESYSVRAGLEAIAAELAAEKLAQDCSALEAHVAALHEADRLWDGMAQARHTVAFHRELVRAAGNSVLLHTWEGLGIEVFTALSIRWLETEQRSYAEEHEELVAAFHRQDPRIAEIVKAHVLGCAPRTGRERS
jgi:DNA-binding GntR family transcriptional regulator